MNYKHKQSESHGFTLVELLIVIVVITILAIVSIVAFNGIKERAQVAKIKSDISLISRGIVVARELAGTTLQKVTETSETPEACRELQAFMSPDKADGPKVIDYTKTYTGAYASQIEPLRQQCWTSYRHAMSAIEVASGVNISNIVDPWGAPYSIDENEGEIIDPDTGNIVCGDGKDSVALLRGSYNRLSNKDPYFVYIPRSAYCEDLYH